MLKRYRVEIFNLLTVSVLILVRSEDIYCPEIAALKNGDTVKSSGPPYGVNTTIKFRCDRGYRGKGSINIICLPNGKWSDGVPICQASFICKRDISRIEKGRKCRKPCETQDDCKGRFKTCTCDDWCGKSCFNPEALCPQPPDIDNGYFSINSPKYGHTVTYKCKDGFILSGIETRTCRSDRKWSGKPPQCIAFSTCGQAGDGRDPLKIGRVIDGTNADVGEWPWQALLFKNTKHNFLKIYEKTSTIAGGSVLTRNWILTAAHVFNGFPSIFKKRNFKNKFLIALGMTIYPDDDSVLEEYIQIYEPENVIPHPEFNYKDYDYDVALIRVGNRLKRSGDKFVVDDSFPSGIITYSHHVRPVCLPCLKKIWYDGDIWGQFEEFCDLDEVKLKTSFAKADTQAYVTGFGLQRNEKTFGRELSGRLMEGLLKIFDHPRCATAVRHLTSILPDARYTHRMICAGSANDSLTTTACQGDSGVPLVEKIEIKGRTHWVQVGIVSWGYLCGNQYPGFYTSITSVMGWIVQNIDHGEEGCKLPEMDQSLVIRDEHKKIRVKEKSKFELGRRISLRCPDEMSLDGSEFAVCRKDGWDVPMTQTCDEKKSCGELIAWQFGSINFQSEAKKAPYPPGTKATLSCQKNYKVTGNSSTTCGDDGQWSNGLGICKIEEKSCGELGAPNFGSLNFQSEAKSAPFPPGARATLSCDYNHKVVGSISATCGDDGQWSNGLGICEKDDPGCAIKLDEVPDHNSVFDAFFAMLAEDRQFQSGDFIIIQCMRSFTMMGTSCNENKRWEPALDDLYC